MSETERRTQYVLGRILIESSRILSPQFGAQGISLSGAQVELLRNVVAYLRRDTTFVDEYHEGYYFRATTSDFDTIQGIVSDLEDKLMANDNTMWGYNARLQWQEVEISDNAGTFNVNVGPVPAGEVWVVENALVRHNEGGSINCGFATYMSENWIDFTPRFLVQTGLWYGGPTNLTLGPGDYVIASFWGLSVGKTAEFSGTGYTMKVPE